MFNYLSSFLYSKSGNLDKQTCKGSTALHYCCLTDNVECLKLLLRGKASIEIGKRVMCTSISYLSLLQIRNSEVGISAFSPRLFIIIL